MMSAYVETATATGSSSRWAPARWARCSSRPTTVGTSVALARIVYVKRSARRACRLQRRLSYTVRLSGHLFRIAGIE